MRILAVDVGTGTQDVLVFDSERPIENCVKLILPSATEVAARRIRAALARGDAPLVLEGIVAGGGQLRGVTTCLPSLRGARTSPNTSHERARWLEAPSGKRRSSSWTRGRRRPWAHCTIRR